MPNDYFKRYINEARTIENKDLYDAFLMFIDANSTYPLLATIPPVIDEDTNQLVDQTRYLYFTYNNNSYRFRFYCRDFDFDRSTFLDCEIVKYYEKGKRKVMESRLTFGLDFVTGQMDDNQDLDIYLDNIMRKHLPGKHLKKYK